MPGTGSALLILLFAILPGIPGHSIYSNFIGADWRLKDWEKVARILFFSLMGFILYSIIANLSSLPQPIYIFPATFELFGMTVSDIPAISLALFGHILSSAATGLIFGLTSRRLSIYWPASTLQSSWDKFIRTNVPKHWVIVGLNTGDVFAGMLDSADVSVTRSERDIIISEPAGYDRNINKYTALAYQSMYIPGEIITSIATLHDPDIDSRITEIGKDIFRGAIDA